MNIEESDLKKFVEDWWTGYLAYEPGQIENVRHVFKVVSKEHFVDFLRDALIEFAETH
jgi:hypothetical protein